MVDAKKVSSLESNLKEKKNEQPASKSIKSILPYDSTPNMYYRGYYGLM